MKMKMKGTSEITYLLVNNDIKYALNNITSWGYCS